MMYLKVDIYHQFQRQFQETNKEIKKENFLTQIRKYKYDNIMLQITSFSI